MNPLSKNLLLFCLLLLTACANQDQDHVAIKPDLPTQRATARPVESLIEPGSVIAHEEPKHESAQQRDNLPVGGTAMPRTDIYVSEKMAMNHGVVAMPYPSPAPPLPDLYIQHPLPDREQYGMITDNPVKLVSESPVSTFSIDVDTGAYANVRRMLNAGQLPPADAVRIEEMINYFPYAYTLPKGNAPFAVHTEMAPAPWHPSHVLLRIGIKGQDVAKSNLPPSNLVFLVDVSGSMSPPERLPLLKSSLKLLIKQLRPQDRVSLVTYASGTQVVLEPTSGAQQAKIMAALDNLHAGGSTAGAAGIMLAYSMAEQGYIKGGINRILLSTDGDFNVGITDFDSLKKLAEEKRKSGISLSTLGFGVGNYNEKLMEQLADAGNGNYSYIDTLNEGHKVLVDEMTSTLTTIAKDVKIQVEFNPNVVSEYRLVGYENRMLKREDFNNDKVDAGEVGAGHTVTALYELTLKGDTGSVDPLRYGNASGMDKSDGPNKWGRINKSGELAFLRLRYKAPDGDISKLIEWPLHQRNIQSSLTQASPEFRFAAAVAAFGQLLRGGKHTSAMDYGDIAKLAADARGTDTFGYRGEFLRLVNLAQSLSIRPPVVGMVD